MTEINDIKSIKRLLVIKNVFSSLKQLSWQIRSIEKRYPAPEIMTLKEIDELVRLYLALGFDIEQIYKDWKKIYKEYKDGTK